MTLKRRDFIRKTSAGVASLAGAAAFSAPFVHAQKKYQWKMVTTWPKNFPGLGTGAEFLASTIERLSSKRITVKVYGAGELVPAMGVFDAVSRGTAEMGHGASYYWKGKSEATQFFAAVPFGLNAAEMMGWVRYGGAQKLWDELYSQFGLKPFMAGNTGVQMGGWFNKEIKKPEDFKGLKIRMPGLGGDVLRKLGATVVTLSGGEIFQSLKSGAIDASEWVGPYNDLAFGLYKAAKYYYWPGWHEPGTALECMVNLKAFNELPADLKAVVETTCQAANDDMLSEFSTRNAAALETLVRQHKVKVVRFPDPVLKEIGKLSRDVIQEAASDPFTKKVNESFAKFRKQSTDWNEISETGYALARKLSVPG